MHEAWVCQLAVTPETELGDTEANEDNVGNFSTWGMHPCAEGGRDGRSCVTDTNCSVCVPQHMTSA